jgi:hypothetical protein
MRRIQRLCAEGRLAGIYIDSVKVDRNQYDELVAYFGAGAGVGFTGLRINTANGVCEVWRRK